MIEFSYFLGIDQTGAACSQGRKAKPLKVCLAKKSQNGWEFHSQASKQQPLIIEGLTPTAIRTLLESYDLEWPQNKLAIIADCVLGMPKNHWPRLGKSSQADRIWKLFQKAREHSYNGANFGLNVSESFFSQFIKDKGIFTKRYCEEISGSNSLFTTRPFQKNIQTGSYRIWRDLVTERPKPWLNIWPFNSEICYDPKSPWLFEGYPSLFWQQYLEIPSRKSLKLITKLKSAPFKGLFNFDTFSQIQSDPDLCDAAVLALGGILLQDKNKLITPFSSFWETPAVATEGWISGLDEKS